MSFTPTAEVTFITANVVYREIRTWNNNGWTNGFAPAPYTRINISDTVFTHDMRLRQRNLTDSAWDNVRTRSSRSSATWIQFRETFGNRRPRWNLTRTSTGAFDGNPTIQFWTGGGSFIDFNDPNATTSQVVWSNSLRTVPPTSDNNPDAYKSNSGLSITVDRSQNVTS